MKHLITLISALAFISASVHADDIKKNKKSRTHQIANAPFVWGDPVAEAPTELRSVEISKLSVPVAPFEWGSAEVLPESSGDKPRAAVPVAPFILGSPDAEITPELTVPRSR